MTVERPDPDAMLVALVLVPSMYSRNRRFDLYQDPAARKVRRRASMVRSVIGHLTAREALRRAELVRVTTMPAGRMELTYEVRTLGFRRTVTLEPIELSLVRFALAHVHAQNLAPLAADDPDRLRIERALRHFAPGARGQAAPDTDPLEANVE